MSKLDVPAFRLQAFEHDWVGRFERDSTPAFNAALGEESRRWILLGQRIGYFAADTPQDVYVEDSAAGLFETDEAVAQIEDPDEFAAALWDAQDDLTPRRRAYIQLLMFADDDTWDDAIVSLRSYVRQLGATAPGESLPLLPKDLGWALSGAESDLEDDLRSPANWRAASCGKRHALADRNEALEDARAELLEMVTATRALSLRKEPQGLIESLRALRVAYKRYFANPRPERWDECVARFEQVTTALTSSELAPVVDQRIMSAVELGQVTTAVAADKLLPVSTTDRELSHRLGGALGYSEPEVQRLFAAASKALVSAHARHISIKAPASSEELLERLHRLHGRVKLVYAAPARQWSRRERRRVRGQVRRNTESELFAVGVLLLAACGDSSDFGLAMALNLGVMGSAESLRRRLKHDVQPLLRAVA